MTYCYFFLILGNLSLFYFVMNSFLYAFHLEISVFPMLILSLAATLGFFLDGKIPKLRYLSLVFMPLAFLGVRNIYCALFILLTVLYTAESVVHTRFNLSYEERLQLFRSLPKVLAVCFFPVMITNVFYFLEDEASLPAQLSFLSTFLLIFVVSTVLLMQILRHDTAVITQPKFRMICLGIFAAIFVLIFIITTDQFIDLVKYLIWVLFASILGPLITMIGTAVGSIIWFILEPIYPFLQSLVHSLALNRPQGTADNSILEESLKDFVSTPVTSFGQLFRGLLSFAIIIGGIILLVRMVKKLNHRFQYSRARLSRSTMTQKERQKEDIPLDLAPPGEPRKAVRYYYRCFLRTCWRFGLIFPPDANSWIVARDSRECFQDESLPKIYELREIYIKARYSNHRIKNEDVNHIKALYEELSGEENFIQNKKAEEQRAQTEFEASFNTLPPRQHENFDHLQN